MLFGGRGHKTYLGCLNCSSDARDSIWNESGAYGHCPIGGDSLYCIVSDFRTIVGNYSACSFSAKDPPVIVDHAGNSYGRFSAAAYMGHEDSVCRYGRRYDEGACDAVQKVCE